MFYQIAVGDRAVPQVSTGIHIDGRENSPRSVPPRLGEHTDIVLQNMLGMNEAERRRLTEQSITRGERS
jgi:crotonobetainyl-CoA:carnitine CoA-transferase CaiB-like acyl-CoA transferase